MNINDIFGAVLPSERILSDNFEDDYGRSTTGNDVKINAVLKPASVEEIKKIVHLANEHGLKLYPISAGKNWGYSDALPVEDHNIILDLGLMNKVLDYNAELSYITIQPGVTQKILADFLEEHGDQHIISVTGSSMHASIVGNYLERGFGISPIMDHAAAVTSLKAVLGNGELYEPFLSKIGQPVLDKIYHYDLGPKFNDIFFQSGMGIVTEMTIKLGKKAESTLLVEGIVKENQIDRVYAGLVEMREKWNLPTLTLKVLNCPYVLAASGVKYPASYNAEDKILSREQLIELSKQMGVSDYTYVITCNGPKSLTKAVARDVKKILIPVSQGVNLMRDAKYRLAVRAQFLLPATLKKKVEILKSVWAYMQGKPANKTLKFAYWRTGKECEDVSKLHPAKDDCGIIWFAPIMPFTAKAFKEFSELAHRVCPKYRINPMLNVTNYMDNYAIGLIAITYDKKKQLKQAHDCYIELLEEGAKLGFYPYRLASFAMADVYKDGGVLAQVKAAVDPKAVISPGRYEQHSS